MKTSKPALPPKIAPKKPTDPKKIKEAIRGVLLSSFNKG